MSISKSVYISILLYGSESLLKKLRDLWMKGTNKHVEV